MDLIVYIFVAIFGLIIGSFLNVIIYRVPNNISIIKPNSHCPNCKHPIAWYDNIPIFSYLFLKGKCRYCKAKISPIYIIVEFLNMVLWLISALLFWKSSVLMAIIFMITSSILLVVAMIDAEHQIIPDRFQIMLLILGIVSCIFLVDIPFTDRLWGLALGGGLFLLLYGISYIFLKREAMGFGDVKLMAVCGLILGWQKIFLAILIGSILGSIILLIINKQEINKNIDETKNVSKSKQYPFAPFLVFGVVCSMFLGDIIINFYSSLIT